MGKLQGGLVVALLVVALLVAACGGATEGGGSGADTNGPPPTNGDRWSGSANEGGPDLQAVAPSVALCSGTSGDTRTAFTFSSDACCGATMDGQEVMFEPGVVALVVAESCAFQLYDGTTGRTRGGVLDDAERNRWANALPLARLGELNPIAVCNFSGSGVTVRFGGVEHSASCGDAATALRRGIDAIRARVDNGTVQSTPATDAVRFALVRGPERESTAASGAYRNAPLWPLPTAPAALLGEGREATGSVDGQGASALRAIRESYFAGAIGDPTWSMVPVVDSDGNRFVLWARDRLANEK